MEVPPRRRWRRRILALTAALVAAWLAVSFAVAYRLTRRPRPMAAAGVPEGTPVLILAGGRDERARPDEARVIAGRVRPQAELVVFDDGDHVQLARADAPRYREVITGFLSRLATTGSRDQPGTK